MFNPGDLIVQTGTSHVLIVKQMIVGSAPLVQPLDGNNLAESGCRLATAIDLMAFHIGFPVASEKLTPLISYLHQSLIVARNGYNWLAGQADGTVYDPYAVAASHLINALGKNLVSEKVALVADVLRGYQNPKFQHGDKVCLARNYSAHNTPIGTVLTLKVPQTNGRWLCWENSAVTFGENEFEPNRFYGYKLADFAQLVKGLESKLALVNAVYSGMQNLNKSSLTKQEVQAIMLTREAHRSDLTYSTRIDTIAKIIG